MKVSQRGPADGEIAKPVQNDKKLTSTRRQGDRDVGSAAESAKVNISSEARQLQRVAELARLGDEARVEKVKELKIQIGSGAYRPDMEEVAKDIVRSALTRRQHEK